MEKPCATVPRPAHRRLRSTWSVSAFGTDTRLVLAQQKVLEKSNEMTAIPALLDVTGHTITIDAMGCQRSIAKKIKDNLRLILKQSF